MDEMVFSVPVDVTAAREARARIRESAEVDDQDVLDRALVIVTEAIGCAVHRSSAAPADERIEIRLDVSPGRIVGEVRDGRLGFDVPMNEFDERVGPHLYTIDHIARRWGLEFGGGARLWFEVGDA